MLAKKKKDSWTFHPIRNNRRYATNFMGEIWFIFRCQQRGVHGILKKFYKNICHQDLPF